MAKSKGTEEQTREELLAENRARRAEIRADEEAKAARKADGDDGESVSEAVEATAEEADLPVRRADSATGSRRLIIGLGAAVAVLVIAVAVLGYFLATADSDAESGVDRRAVNDAKSYATTVLTYSSGNYADLDKRIREISTPEFADRYIKSSQEARQGNDEAQAKGTAEAKEAGLVSITDSKAVVLVAVNQNVKSPLVPSAGPDGMDYQSRVVITLTRDGDAWKLSDLSVV